MEDNFYANILSWSKNDLIAIVLANSIFVFNNSNGNIEKIYKAFDCEEITSLCWNNEGT